MASSIHTTALNEPNEKSLGVHEITSGIDTPTTKDDASSLSDGDDALKLAGTHAHTFDEKYYARLRRKIVCFAYAVELAKVWTDNTIGPTYHAYVGIRVFYTIPR